MTTTTTNNSNVEFYVIEDNTIKATIEQYKDAQEAIQSNIQSIDRMVFDDGEHRTHSEEFRNQYRELISMNPGSDGWNELTEDSGKYYFSEPDEAEYQQLSPQAAYDRIRNCHELEYLYIIKHNELITLFDLIFLLIEFLCRVIQQITMIIIQLDRKKCGRGRKIKAPPTKALFKNLIKAQKNIGEYSKSLQENLNALKNTRLSELFPQSAGANSSPNEETVYSHGLEQHEGEYYQSLRISYEELLRRCNAAREHIQDYKNLIRDSGRVDETKIDKIIEAELIDDEGWNSLSESDSSKRYIDPSSSGLENSFKLFMNKAVRTQFQNNSGNNLTGRISTPEEIEQFLRRCYELEILYLKKHDEVLNTFNFAKEMALIFVEVMNNFITLITLIGEKKCLDIKIIKLPNSILTNTKKLVESQNAAKERLSVLKNKNIPSTYMKTILRQPIIPQLPRRQKKKLPQTPTTTPFSWATVPRPPKTPAKSNSFPGFGRGIATTKKSIPSAPSNKTKKKKPPFNHSGINSFKRTGALSALAPGTPQQNRIIRKKPNPLNLRRTNRGNKIGRKLETGFNKITGRPISNKTKNQTRSRSQGPFGGARSKKLKKKYNKKSRKQRKRK